MVSKLVVDDTHLHVAALLADMRSNLALKRKIYETIGSLALFWKVCTSLQIVRC
jgi:hypothetical protein